LIPPPLKNNKNKKIQTMYSGGVQYPTGSICSASVSFWVEKKICANILTNSQGIYLELLSVSVSNGRKPWGSIFNVGK
jgi:hypothetical protein